MKALLFEVRRTFRKLTAVELAAAELAEAELALLEAQSGREYADSMVRYHEARIDRLKSLLHLQQARQQQTAITPRVVGVA